MQRRGDWIQTYSGVEFYPLDPRPEEIRIEDIAHALSMQCRYTGHVQKFYSVAEHSLRVAEIVPKEWRLWALLHDASEAYLVDLPRPIKRGSILGELYREAEDALMIYICARFGLTWMDPMPGPVEQADKGMLFVEARDLMPPHPCWQKWKNGYSSLARPIFQTMQPGEAESAFLAEFKRLAGAVA